MQNVKISKPAKELDELLVVTVSTTQYFFQGNMDEIRNTLIQGQFDNFYPYQDTELVNDMKAFDRSVLNDINDHARNIVSLMGFSTIEEYQESPEYQEPSEHESPNEIIEPKENDDEPVENPDETNEDKENTQNEISSDENTEDKTVQEEVMNTQEQIEVSQEVSETPKEESFEDIQQGKKSSKKKS